VRVAEFLKIRHEAVAVLLALLGSDDMADGLGDMAGGLEEATALHIHGRREHDRISVPMAKSCA
jgi:hypothetical protein